MPPILGPKPLQTFHKESLTSTLLHEMRQLRHGNEKLIMICTNEQEHSLQDTQDQK